ncbi:hypothetical protein C8R46DRAFT_1060999 [Mycena filopes]|nr:hypothetical protein C8R46DRAFT_1060999 [Mycena filopes]
MPPVVPLSALTTTPEVVNAPLTRKYLFPDDDVRLQRRMEYLWGLEINTLNTRHQSSILHIHQSMATLPPGSWTLAPTEETLAAMEALQKHNYTVPVSERISFLDAFSAAEYEYAFVPNTDVEILVLEPGQTPRRFSAPYDNFPLVTSSANPFFVTFNSRLMLSSSDASPSQQWDRLFSDLTIEWFHDPPDDFLFSCYPRFPPDSKCGSDETVATPMDESPSFVPDKVAFVDAWLRDEAGQPQEEPVCSTPSPTWPPAPQEKARRLREAIKLYPCWHRETKRGVKWTERLFARQPLDHEISISLYSRNSIP